MYQYKTGLNTLRDASSRVEECCYSFSRIKRVGERALDKTTEGSNVDAYGISDLKTLCCFRWASSHAPHPVFRIETIPRTCTRSRCPVSRVPSLRLIGILKSFSLAQNNFSKKKKESNKMHRLGAVRCVWFETRRWWIFFTRISPEEFRSRYFIISNVGLSIISSSNVWNMLLILITFLDIK